MTGGATVKLADYLTWWLDQQTILLHRPEHLDRLHQRRKHVARLLDVAPPVRLGELRPTHIETMWAGLHAGRHDVFQPLSVSYVRNIATTLRAALDTAVRDNILTSNPATAVTVQGRPASPAEQHVVLSRQERRRLLDATRRHAARPGYDLAIFIAAHTGMRLGEVLGLRWGDIDFNRRRITIARQIQYRVELPKGQRYTVTNLLKTDSSRRIIEAPTELIDTLAVVRHTRTTETISGYIVVTATGLHGRHQGAERRLARLVDTLGLPSISPHGLRHTVATLLLAEARWPLAHVAAHLGHRDTLTTLRTYAHVLPSGTGVGDALDQLG